MPAAGEQKRAAEEALGFDLELAKAIFACQRCRVQGAV